MDRFYELTGDKDAFRSAAEQLPDNSTPLHVKNMLLAPPPSISPLAKLLGASAPPTSSLAKMRQAVADNVAKDATVLTCLDRYFEVILQLLNYEANGPFYPWYEEEAHVDKSILTTKNLGLDAATAKVFDDYVKTLPGA